jgi:hypothetical protein
MMSSINNINNTNTNNNTITINPFFQKSIKQEDSKLNAYILRKQLGLSFTTTYHNSKMDNSHFIPPMKSTLKNQVEELQKLQSEVSYMENKVNELELSKRVKQTKV